MCFRLGHHQKKKNRPRPSRSPLKKKRRKGARAASHQQELGERGEGGKKDKGECEHPFWESKFAPPKKKKKKKKGGDLVGLAPGKGRGGRDPITTLINGKKERRTIALTHPSFRGGGERGGRGGTGNSRIVVFPEKRGKNSNTAASSLSL